MYIILAWHYIWWVSALHNLSEPRTCRGKNQEEQWRSRRFIVLAKEDGVQVPWQHQSLRYFLELSLRFPYLVTLKLPNFKATSLSFPHVHFTCHCLTRNANPLKFCHLHSFKLNAKLIPDVFHNWRECIIIHPINYTLWLLLNLCFTCVRNIAH